MKALLIIDVQNALVELNPYNKEKLVKNLQEMLEEARRQSVEVIYIQHDGGVGSLTEVGSNGFKIYPEIEPKDDLIFVKTFNSAFKDTKLESYLKSKKINELIIVGMQTDYCVDATVKVAFEKGFEVVIPRDSNSTYDNGELTASQIHQYYNDHIYPSYATVVSHEIAMKRLKD